MQLTEAQIDGLPCGPGRCGADAKRLQHEQDFDVFALDSLDLYEVQALPGVNSALGCSAQQQSTVQLQAPQPEAAQRKNKVHKVEQIRAQNREAQARYRQKAKVHSPRVMYMRYRVMYMPAT